MLIVYLKKFVIDLAKLFTNKNYSKILNIIFKI